MLRQQNFEILSLVSGFHNNFLLTSHFAFIHDSCTGSYNLIYRCSKVGCALIYPAARKRQKGYNLRRTSSHPSAAIIHIAPDDKLKKGINLLCSEMQTNLIRRRIKIYNIKTTDDCNCFLKRRVLISQARGKMSTRLCDRVTKTEYL